MRPSEFLVHANLVERIKIPRGCGFGEQWSKNVGGVDSLDRFMAFFGFLKNHKILEFPIDTKSVPRQKLWGMRFWGGGTVAQI